MVQLERRLHLVHDAVLTAVMHGRRFAAIVTAAAQDVSEEFRDMVWDYRHMASAEPRSPEAD
jgi:hypothetical protein